METYYSVSTDPFYLEHHGIKGQRWGVRRYQNEDGTLTSAGKKRYDDSMFTASNGVKVAKAKNSFIKGVRTLASNRAVEKANIASYRLNTKTRHAQTDSNRLEIEKGVQRMKKESAALREYNAHQKDFRKGTGTKYLDKAVRKNKIYDAHEKVNSNSTRMDRVIYNDATRKKAAKYMVDKNMSMKEATSKAKKEALRNTAIIVAAYGGLTLAAIKKMK